jgi:hypothetical protein
VGKTKGSNLLACREKDTDARIILRLILEKWDETLNTSGSG